MNIKYLEFMILNAVKDNRQGMKGGKNSRGENEVCKYDIGS